MNNNCVCVSSPAAASSEVLAIINNVLNNLNSKSKKSIAVIALSNGEKTVNAIRDIVITAASLDRKILFVDANSQSSNPYDLPEGKGLQEFVCDGLDVVECINHNAAMNCDVMSTGALDSGINVLHNILFEDKIKQLEEMYDIVIYNVTNVTSGVVKTSFANKIGLSMVVIDKNKDIKFDLISTRDTLSDCIGLVVLQQKKLSFKERFCKTK